MVIFVHMINQIALSCPVLHCTLLTTSRIPVEGESSVCVCVICMKYRIIILIIIIISLGQIIVSYMANTSRTHAHTHTHAHTSHTPTHRRRRPGCRCSMGRSAPNHDEVNASFSPVPLAMNGRSVLHSNKQSRMRRGIRDRFWCFSRIKIKILGRTVTRTRDRMIRTV